MSMAGGACRRLFTLGIFGAPAIAGRASIASSAAGHRLDQAANLVTDPVLVEPIVEKLG